MIYLSIVAFFYPILGGIIIFFVLTKHFDENVQNIKKLHIPLAFLYAMFGYSMVLPSNDIDLGRYYIQMESMQRSDLLSIVKNDYELLYTRDILFYLIGKTRDVHLLPYVVGGIIYAIVFYVIFDRIEHSQRNFTIREIAKLMIISVSIVSPYSIIGNTRCILAYTLISFAVYRELVQNKMNIFTVILYILPIGMHSSAVIILLIRLIQFGARKLGVGLAFIALIFPALINLCHSYVGILGNNMIGRILVAAINKAYSYLHWTEGGWASEIQNSISNKVFRLYGILYLFSIIILLIISLYLNKKNCETKKIIDAPMVSYLYIVLVCALGCLHIVTGAFWRFETIMVLFSVIIFVPLMEMNNWGINKIINLIYLSSLIMFFVNSYHMYRNLEVIDTIINIISFNGFKIIYSILRGILNF